jgi:NitT/TauT family transport system ATP-binding protein
MALPGILIDIAGKAFGEREVIGPLAFSVERGEFIALIGPSGCGKTTLLNLLAGLDSDFDGAIHFADPAGGRPAYVFQAPRLMPWLTVAQNIELVYGDAPADTARLLRQFGLEDCRGAFPSQLSGGMRRRVALARAFAIEPGLLLLDEPFLSLDQPSANRLRDLLTEQWQAQDSSVIFVTHALEEALALADRILFLSRSPMQLLHEYRVETERPRRIGSAALAAEADHLLQLFPDLLQG